MDAQAQFEGVVEATRLVFERSDRARNYRLTLRKDGVAQATIPLRGTEREAARFVEQHRDWPERAGAAGGQTAGGGVLDGRHGDSLAG